ncbi:hypothetical protein D5086_021244 [Populus alba]|uniref:Uncharacterized protein n=1 Tax=Populus alba TaxID=43335 RepID=A0ACC4BCF9_POPAL
MASSRFLFSVCLLFMKVLAMAQQPSDQPVMLYKDCVGKGNYTTNSTYQANLNQLLTSIYTNTEINNGFYNFSYGQDADTVYSIALCRPDISPDVCRVCIRNASDSLVRLCPNFVEAIGGLDNCMVRYTNRSIFNRMEKGPYFWVYDDRVNVSDVVGFNQSRMTLLGRKGKKRNVIIIIVIVPIAVSVILIVCVCIFLRARKQKEEEEVKGNFRGYFKC